MDELESGRLAAQRHQLDQARTEARAALRRLRRVQERLAGQDDLVAAAADAEEMLERLLQRLEQASQEQRQRLRRALLGGEADP
jgi:DNA repair exonuclease SbcCD ATPase subunit